MNNSTRTTIIAQGIAHWAEVMNLPQNEAANAIHPKVRKWGIWSATYPQFAEFVKREQFALFDRVNAAF